MERCTFDELWYMDAGVTTLDDDNARRLLCEALTHVPTEVADKIIENCLVLIPQQSSEGGYVISPKLSVGRTIMAFPKSILTQSPRSDAVFTVLHEVTHVWLGFKDALSDSAEWEAYENQERDTDDQARAWLDADT